MAEGEKLKTVKLIKRWLD